jgi:hypothetical protein
MVICMLILVDDHLFPGHSFASHQRTNQSERAREMAAASIRYRHSTGDGSHGRRLLWLLLACSWVAAARGQQQTARTDPAEGTYIYVQQLSIGSLPYVSVIPYVSCMHTSTCTRFLTEITSIFSTNFMCKCVILHVCVLLVSLGAKFSSVHKAYATCNYMYFRGRAIVQWRR